MNPKFDGVCACTTVLDVQGGSTRITSVKVHQNFHSGSLGQQSKTSPQNLRKRERVRDRDREQARKRLILSRRCALTTICDTATQPTNGISRVRAWADSQVLLHLQTASSVSGEREGEAGSIPKGVRSARMLIGVKTRSAC